MRKLLNCHLGLRPFDDRDSYLNKRVDTPGVMLANLFRQYYGKMIKDCKNVSYKELNSGVWKTSSNINNLINSHNIYKIIKPTTIESGLKYGLATGNWGIKNINSKQGVAQVLNRLTFYATLSHLRRVNTPIEKSGKLIQPRKLHNTQWGIICPAETPEGGSVGLVKNLAIAAKVTVASNSEFVSGSSTLTLCATGSPSSSSAVRSIAGCSRFIIPWCLMQFCASRSDILFEKNDFICQLFVLMICGDQVFGDGSPVISKQAIDSFPRVFLELLIVHTAGVFIHNITLNNFLNGFA